MCMRIARMVLVSLLLTGMVASSGCGYNDLQGLDEDTKAAWSEVINQYQRRADLIPNLVRTVKGFADQEKEVLTRVTEARASVAGMKVTPELVNDPEAMARFQKAQGELSGALSRLLVVSENYPNLTIRVPEANAYYLGQLFFFFEKRSNNKTLIINVGKK